MRMEINRDDYEFIEELEMGLDPIDFEEYKLKEAESMNFGKDFDEDTVKLAIKSMVEDYEYEYITYNEELTNIKLCY